MSLPLDIEGKPMSPEAREFLLRVGRETAENVERAILFGPDNADERSRKDQTFARKDGTEIVFRDYGQGGSTMEASDLNLQAPGLGYTPRVYPSARIIIDGKNVKTETSK